MKKVFFIAAIVFSTFGTKMLDAQILSVTPDTVEQGQFIDIEVTAENIDFTQGTNIVQLTHGITELYISDMVANNATTLILSPVINSDNPVGFYDLSIHNTFSGTNLSKTNALYVNPDLTPASIDSIAPDSSAHGEITITIYGKNTNFDKPGVVNSVYLKNAGTQIDAITIDTINSAELEAQFNFTYSDPNGLYILYVQNALDGTQSSADTFRLLGGTNTPSIQSIDPDTVYQGQTLDITVTGVNIDFTQGTNLAMLKNGTTEIYMNSLLANSPTSLTTNFTFSDTAPLGYYDLSITNYGPNPALMKENAIYLKSKTIIGFDEIPEDIFSFFPNPANNYIYFRKNCELAELYDMNGRKILESRQTNIIDISNLNKGIYIIRMMDSGNLTITKFIKD